MMTIIAINKTTVWVCLKVVQWLKGDDTGKPQI